MDIPAGTDLALSRYGSRAPIRVGKIDRGGSAPALGTEIGGWQMEMIKNLKERDEKGFTLIELLVVVAIIGILAAIAIPQFSAYREQGFDAQASSHLRNIALAQEAYFAQEATYSTDVASLAPAVQTDSDIPVTVALKTGGFTLQAAHASGGKTFNWDSTLGGLQDNTGSE